MCELLIIFVERKILGKVIAIDFGLKRTGLALSDESKTFAFGLKTVESKHLIHELKQLVPKEKIDTIVLGEPKRLDGSDSHISENVRLLKEVLTTTFPQLKVVSLDERFTSKMASAALFESGFKMKSKADKVLIDEVSATIILQDYLHQL